MMTLVCLWAALGLAQVDAEPADDVAALGVEIRSLIEDTGAAKDGGAESLAARCGLVAEAADDADTRLAARLMQAQAYYASALDAIAQSSAGRASMRLVQLRSAANAARRVNAPEAKLAGDGWLLLADLVDTRRNAR